MTWIKIAVRNIFKNGRRSIFTVFAVGIGFAAVNIFGGFQTYVFRGLRDALVYAQGEGHLAVFKRGVSLYDNKIDPAHSLIKKDEIDSARRILNGYPEVVLVTGELQISGLLSNGDDSTIFVGAGRTPSDMQEIRDHCRGFIAKIPLYDGDPLRDDLTYGIGVSSGLARKLDVGIGSEVIAMGPTVDGQVNALDAQIRQLFESPAALLNDKQILVPLSFAQSLFNTDSVKRLIVLLDETGKSDSMKQRLNSAFARAGLDMDVRTWVDIAPFYTKVKNMFSVIFLFLFSIVLVIVVMSVINTMSMSVMERIREIGTLRALGSRRIGIVKLFALEGALLGVFGCGLGIVLTLAGWCSIKLAEPTWIPPHITRRVPIEVYLVPEYLGTAAFCLVVLSLAAAVWPARKSARMNIIDALGHV